MKTNEQYNSSFLAGAKSPVPDDAELSILENIYSSQKRSLAVTQRDLAEASGLSLGMTNALLKRFADKGWLMLKKLNSRNIQYALTPEGVNEIAHRTYRYFRRTARAAGLYKDRIESWVISKKREGASRIVFAGVSDLDFLFEYASERHGLIFVKSADPEKALRLRDDASTVVVRVDDLDAEKKEKVRQDKKKHEDIPFDSLSGILIGQNEAILGML
ncbi:hypothetical protein MASR2M29_03490 [Spirochaetota bacterium]